MLPQVRSTDWNPSSSELWSWRELDCPSTSQSPDASVLDSFGRHRAVCPRSGRLRTRAVGPERTLARVCREAGATVRYNTKLRDMNVAVAAEDERAIEVLASGLPIRQGVQFAVDVTVRCVLTADGLPTPRAARHHGAALLRARADKERKIHRVGAQRQVPVVWLLWKLGAVVVTKRRNSSANWLVVGHGRSHRCRGQLFSGGCEGGRGCCPFLAAGLSRVLW